MNKRILISNNDSEEIEILVESLFNKATQVPNRRLLVIVTDTDYYEELLEAIKSKMETITVASVVEEDSISEAISEETTNKPFANINANEMKEIIESKIPLSTNSLNFFSRYER